MANDDSFEHTAQIFGVLSHPNRLKIILSLSKQEMCVEDIQRQIGCLQCNVSQHLVLLKKKNLVSARRVGRRVYYSLMPSELLDEILKITTILHRSHIKYV